MGSGSHSKRNKKGSQKRSKKRIRSTRDKTKKPKRRQESVTSSDEDSMSNLSMSCYSSEDDHRSRKRARSRDRKDRKKRVKNSLVSESSGDDTPHLKKRKRSKKSKVSESGKKRHGKKRKRDRSVSVSSGRSWSCSSGEHGNGVEKEVKKSETKERKGREEGKGRSGSKKSRPRSRSCSPSSLRSVNHSYDSEERVIAECNPKRLKSVIVATRDIEDIEVKGSNWDGNKDEIVCEHDDYPSRSNDSNEGVCKRETLSYLNDVSSEKPRSVDDSNRLASPTNVQTSEFPESQRLNVEEIERLTFSSSNSGVDQLKGTSSDVSVANAGSKRDDLEVALRQKALENLLKHQGKLPIKNAADKKGNLDNEVKLSSSLKTGQVQHLSGEQRAVKSVQNVGTMDGANITNVPSAPKVNDDHLHNCELGTCIPMANQSPSGFVNSRSKLGLAVPGRIFTGGRNIWRRQVSQESSKPKLSVLKETEDEDYARKQVLQEPSQPNLSSLTETVNGDYKQKLVLQESSQANLSALVETVNDDHNRKVVLQKCFQTNLSAPGECKDKDPKQRLVVQASCQLNVSASKEAVLTDSSRGSGSACLESKVSTQILSNATSDPTATGGQSSNDKTNKSDEDSQFQQKTMSVMRGGELVQVNYKVFIPKKPSALARRQLKR